MLLRNTQCNSCTRTEIPRLKTRQFAANLISKSGRHLTADNLHFLYDCYSNIEEHLEMDKSSSTVDWLDSVSPAANSQLNLDNVGVPPVPRPSQLFPACSSLVSLTNRLFLYTTPGELERVHNILLMQI
jgi:hypothetical protein